MSEHQLFWKPQFGMLLAEILLCENLDLNGFCQMVDKRRRGFNFTSAIRVVVVIYYRTLAHEQQQFSGATPSLNQLNAPDPECRQSRFYLLF